MFIDFRNSVFELFCSKSNFFQSNFSKNKLVKTLFFLAIFLTSNFFRVSAQVVNSSSDNNGASHHQETLNNILASERSSLDSLSLTYVNPTNNLASILHEVINSPLNLNSAIDNVSSGHLSGAYEIKIGNQLETVLGNQLITPAESIALNQVMLSNHQSLVLNSTGQAIGGNFNNLDVNGLNEPMLVSKGVAFFDTSPSLNINGNLVNYGDIIMHGSASLIANNVVNENSGLISASDALRLNTNELINFGGIYGGSNVTINSSNVFNSATIEAGYGNINIIGLNDLNLSGSSYSQLIAYNGNINISSLSNIDLYKGNFISHNLNFLASNGYVNGLTDNVTGQINTISNSSNLVTSSFDMLIGNSNIKADPTYVNTSGDISLNGGIVTNGNNLAIIASGNVNISGGTTATINTASSSSGSGGNVVIIAGLGTNVTGGGINSTVVPTGSNAATSNVTVNFGGSGTYSGGNIDLLTNNNLNPSSYPYVINTNSPGNGGSITLVALANSTGTIGGQIILANGTTNYSLLATGVAGGGGSVTLISTATNGTGIDIGAINGGNVIVATASPVAGSLIFDTTGTTNGVISANLSNLTDSNIILNGSITSSSSITVATGGAISIASGVAINPVINLSLEALNGSLGSISSYVFSTANSLNLAAPNGSVYITTTSSSANIGSSVVSNSGTFDFVNTKGSIVVDGDIVAGASNGTGIVNLSVSGSNTITDANVSGSEVVTAGNVYLTSVSGNISSPVSLGFNVNSDNVFVSASANVYVSNLSTDNVKLDISAFNGSGECTFYASGGVVINTPFNDPNGTFVIFANGLITQATSQDTINANLVYLNAGSSSSYSLITNASIIANKINIDLVGGAYGGVLINSKLEVTGSLYGLNIYLYRNGNIETTGNGELISSYISLYGADVGYIGNGLNTETNSLYLVSVASAGIKNISPSLNIISAGAAQNMYIQNTGDITASGIMSAPVMGLYSLNGTNGIGTSSNLMQVSAQNLYLESFNQNSSIYVNDFYNGNTTLLSGISGQIFKLDTAGGLTLYAPIGEASNSITASIIALQSFGGFGIYNDSNLSASDFIFLTASGYIAQPTSAALMIAPNIALVSGGGAIGAGGRILLNGQFVSASTQGYNSFVNIYDASSSSQINGGQAGSYFTFNTNGNVNILGSIATGAGVNAQGGSIEVNANGNLGINLSNQFGLLANNGPIVMIDNNASSGNINIEANSVIATKTTSQPGYIVFNIGSYSQVNTTNPNPTNISVFNSGGANVYFGYKGIVANSGGNILTAKGQDIVFNTGSLSASNLSLGGNDKITADPPVYAIPVNSLGFSEYTHNSSYSASLSQNILNNANSVNFADNNLGSLNMGLNLASDKFINFNSKAPSNSKFDAQNVKNTGLYFLPAACSKQTNSNEFKSLDTNNPGLVANLLESNSYNFYTGSSLIKANANMEIKLGCQNDLKLHLKSGSFVLLISDGSVYSIFNLYDKKDYSVVLEIDQHKKINLSSGQHLSIATNNKVTDFSRINLAKSIAYRGLTKVNLSNKLIFKSDFSLLSAINSIKALKILFNSNDKIAKFLAHELLKTAGVINQCTASRGRYEIVDYAQARAL